MSNYTLKHTSTSTLITVAIKSGGYSALIQYEFKEPISEYKIQKVYDSLTSRQKDNVTRHKTGFKQFVRAILLAYPSVSTGTAQIHKTRADEAKLYISRIAPYIGLSSTDAITGYVTGGAINKKKYNSIFEQSKNMTKVEDENLVYVDLGELVLVSGATSVSREKGKPELYIYAVISRALITSTI